MDSNTTTAQLANIAADCSPPASASVKVLVVDDIEDNLLTTHALLARPGLAVLVAGSAAAALDVLGQHDVALALLDVQMPEVNGFELAEQMRRNDQTRSVPIIFMTGNGVDSSHTFLGYEAGAVDFLFKPIDPRVLESKVGVFVELYRQRQLLRERNAELERLLQLNQIMAEELRKAHGEAVQEAHTDALTGVSNRRHIMQLGAVMLNDRRRQAQPLSLAILDLDHFKAINDTYGHHIGDTVLRHFCMHVRHQIRPSHILGRLGGEEFLLLMPGTQLVDAEVVMERVRQTLESHAGVTYTFSAGMAEAGAGELLPAIVNRADNALYEAKRAGRDCSVTSAAPL
ncbi:MAG: diguanylate cyclase [Pseudomonadota bacterium]